MAENTPMAFSPGMPRNIGRPAPVPMNTASNPWSMSWSMVSVLPITWSVWMVTPSRLRPLISYWTISLGRRNWGMPYMSTPPARCRASNMTTSWPQRAISPATVMPAGPAPTTATRLPVGAALTGSGTPPCLRA